MRTSTKVMVAGGALFALPIPGTFTTGALLAAAGGGYRIVAE